MYEDKDEIPNSYPELLVAAEKGDLNKIRNLLTLGINVDTRDADGFSALHIALIEVKSDKKQYEICKYLLERGINVNLPDKVGDTPLHIAVQHGNFDLTKLLISHGALTGCLNKDEKTAEQIASECEYEEIAEYLRKIHENFYSSMRFVR
jgi:ankyrin repeat protein